MLPIHTVLYPTDFSSCAESAFPVACSVAWDLGARLVALHVAPPPIGHERALMHVRPDEFYAEPLAALHSLRSPMENVRIESMVADGSPTEQVLRTAQKVDAGLIVMGTHGRTGVGRALLGSVSEHVIRESSCPVMAIKSSTAFDPKNVKILVATDLSSASLKALGVAFSLARGYQSPLIVLHVLDAHQPSSVRDFEQQVEQSAEYKRETEEGERRRLPVQPEFCVATGDPATEINRAASELKCNLVVLGTHGRSGLRRAVFGSVAEQTLRHATCPLLLIKQ